MNILLTGGTGMIGSVLTERLLAEKHLLVILSRQKGLNKAGARYISNLSEVSANEHFDAVINLAGEPIANKRWSAAQKQAIRDSRIHLTQDLVALMAQLDSTPQVFVSGSAIGYYGAGVGAEEIIESSSVGGGFAHELCRDWELAAAQANQLKIRTCLLRTGIVLGDGGALGKMLLPFKMGLGGPMGNGEQWMPWIHIEDMIEIILRCLRDEHLAGAINCTAPHPVNNAEFSRCLGGALSRPAIMPMPAFVIKTLMGEMGDELLLQGKRVVPKKLSDIGYEFRFPHLAEALEDVVTK